MICTNCSHKAELFFTITLPVYPFSMAKNVKGNMPKELSQMITLRYNNCPSCGYIFSTITKEEFALLETIYTKYYTYMNRNNITDYSVDELIHVLDPYLKRITSLTEIGCYDGATLLKIHEHFPNMILQGVEPSKDGAKSTLEKGFPVINDFFPTQEKLDSSDLFLSCQVIEHVPNIKVFIQSQLNLLNEGGLIVFETPNVDWALKECSNKPFDFQHLGLLSKRYIKNILLELELEYVNIFEFGWRILVVCSKSKHNDLYPLHSFDFNEKEIDLYLPDYQKNVSIHKERFSTLLSREENGIWIWGASSFCGNILAVLNSHEIEKIDGILDSDPQKEDNEFLFNSIPASLPNQINKKQITKIVIMSTYEKEIFDYIKTLSIDHDMRLYTMYTTLSTYKFDSSKNTITKIDNE